MARFEGWGGVFYDTHENAAYNLAEIIWPILSTALLATPGLIYSYTMAPTPINQRPTALQNMFRRLAWPVTYLYDAVPKPNINNDLVKNLGYAIKTLFRYFAPQYIAHSLFLPKWNQFTGHMWAARGKAFIRPFLEELSKFWSAHVQASNAGISLRDFVMSEQENPGMFARVVNSGVGGAWGLLKSVVYDFPRSNGFLSFLNVKPKNATDLSAEEWYKYGASWIPHVRSGFGYAQSYGTFMYDAAGRFVDTALWPWQKLSQMQGLTDAVNGQGGIDQVLRQTALVFHENAEDFAKRLESITYGNVSSQTWLYGEYAVAAVAAGVSVYYIGKGLSWAGSKISTPQNGILHQFNPFGAPVVNNVQVTANGGHAQAGPPVMPTVAPTVVPSGAGTP